MPDKKKSTSSLQVFKNNVKTLKIVKIETVHVGFVRHTLKTRACQAGLCVCVCVCVCVGGGERGGGGV